MEKVSRGSPAPYQATLHNAVPQLFRQLSSALDCQKGNDFLHGLFLANSKFGIKSERLAFFCGYAWD